VSPHLTHPRLPCARRRIHHNNPVIFLHFGHRCSSSTSPCGSAAGKHLIHYCSLSFSTRPTRRIPVFIAPLSNKIPSSRQGQASVTHTFSSSFVLRGFFLLPDRSNGEPSHHSSFRFCGSLCLARRFSSLQRIVLRFAIDGSAPRYRLKCARLRFRISRHHLYETLLFPSRRLYSLENRMRSP
jgi:hypothetical protein